MPRFLEPLAALHAPMIINTRSGRPVAPSVEVATTRTQRRRGLLGRDALCPGSAFVLAPCGAVHTIGMRFAIDVIFVDDHGGVVKLVHRMTRWRLAIARGAIITIELQAGALEALDVRVGDRLCLAPAFAEGYAPEETRAFEPSRMPPAGRPVPSPA